MATAHKPAGAVQGGTGSGHRSTARLLAAAILGAALAVFAALNSQTVQIHWIVTTTDLPMVVVIFGCGIVGALVAWLVSLRRRARR